MGLALDLSSTSINVISLWRFRIKGIFRACDERTFTAVSADHGILMFSPTSTKVSSSYERRIFEMGENNVLTKTNKLAMNLFRNKCNNDIIDSFTDSVLILHTYVINRGTYVH